MAGPRGYHSYRGRGSKGKAVLAAVLVLVILASVGFIMLQKYIVYDETGTPHLMLPEKPPEQTAPEKEEEPVDLKIQAPETRMPARVQALALAETPLTEWSAAQPEALMHLTAMVAVAAARAIERVSGVYPGIKWTNDLVLGKKKLCGILTEIGIEAESREVDYAVVGIGINCAHAELPPEVAAMSADLETATGKKPDRSRLAAELVRSLYEMEQALFTQKDAWLAEFSAHCVTIGQDVKLVRGDEVQFAHADGIDGEAALRVTYPDGTTGVIASGEVSVRGMYGYT